MNAGKKSKMQSQSNENQDMNEDELTNWWICSALDKCKGTCHTRHNYPHRNNGRACANNIRCSANDNKNTPCKRMTISEYATYRLLKC